MTAYEIPLINQSQVLSISLAGVTYNLAVTWRNAASTWFLDIYDQTGSTLIVGGIPLVTGADLLAQYEYLGLGGGLVAMTDGDPTVMPAYSNLGASSHLYFLVYD